MRTLLGQHGLSAESIPATGPKGHLLKGCVRRDPDFMPLVAHWPHPHAGPLPSIPLPCFSDVLRYIDEGGKPATDEKKASKKPKKTESEKEAPRATSAGSGAPTPTGVRRRRRGEPHKDVPISGMRKVIASRLTESKVRLRDT